MDRCWAVSTRPGSNLVALGYDEGVTVVKIGRDSPAASMDESGKIIYAKQNDVMIMAVRSAIDAGTVVDGERIVCTDWIDWSRIRVTIAIAIGYFVEFYFQC